ncbi:MAG: cytochrome c, partial [Ilumatobacteraceae bacterium]
GAARSAVDSQTAQADGAQLFQAKGCSSCHAGPGSPATFESGFPSLANATDWAGDRRPGVSAEAYLTESIAAPGVFISPEFHPGQSGPTTGMPALTLSAAEIDALVTYLLER